MLVTTHLPVRVRKVLFLRRILVHEALNDGELRGVVLVLHHMPSDRFLVLRICRDRGQMSAIMRKNDTRKMAACDCEQLLPSEETIRSAAAASNASLLRQQACVKKERDLQIDVAFRSSFFISSTCSCLTSTWQTGSARMAPYRKRGRPGRLSTANSVSVKDRVRDRLSSFGRGGVMEEAGKRVSTS